MTTPPEQGQQVAAQIKIGEIVRMATVRHLPPGSTYNETVPFADLGIESRAVIQIRAELVQQLGRTISSTALFDHPTPQDLIAALSDMKEP